MRNTECFSVISIITTIGPGENCEKYLLSSESFTRVNNIGIDICEKDVCDREHLIYIDYLGKYSPVRFKIDNHPFVFDNDNNFGTCSHLNFIFHNKSIRRFIKLRLDVSFFSCVLNELKRSAKFRRNLLLNVYYIFNRKLGETRLVNGVEVCNACKNVIWTIHVVARLQPPKKEVIDILWNKRIELLVAERCELENAMAWLSTLGGAFSSLGDSDIYFAEKAGVISLQQLKLALRLGDPLTVCQCKIYLAISFLQRGLYKTAKIITRETYDYAINGEGKKDFRLRNMCMAMLNRLKYAKSQRTLMSTKYGCSSV